MKEFEYIAAKIKIRRERLHYTQKDLAELTGISVRTIRSIENAEGSTSIKSWYQIIDILGMEMKAIIKPMNDETGPGLL